MSKNAHPCSPISISELPSILNIEKQQSCTFLTMPSNVSNKYSYLGSPLALPGVTHYRGSALFDTRPPLCQQSTHVILTLWSTKMRRSVDSVHVVVKISSVARPTPFCLGVGFCEHRHFCITTLFHQF
jgi:hypothetical protein